MEQDLKVVLQEQTFGITTRTHIPVVFSWGSCSNIKPFGYLHTLITQTDINLLQYSYRIPGRVCGGLTRIGHDWAT